MGSWEYTTDPLVDISPEETCLAATKGRLDRCQACLGPRNPCLAVVLLATWFHFFFFFFSFTVYCGLCNFSHNFGTISDVHIKVDHHFFFVFPF